MQLREEVVAMLRMLTGRLRLWGVVLTALAIERTWKLQL